jgi:hypothetical protein
MRIFLSVTLAAAVLVAGATSLQAADEAEFLNSLDGQWSGSGTVKIRTNRDPINVTCNFQSNGIETALSLDGKCRGLLIVSRSISVDLKTDGGRYHGQYLGAGTGPANLAGSREGNQINLTIRWAKEVNGDRRAELKVRKVGDNGMKLTTVDVDPESGKRVVTSEINLVRE